MYTVKFAEVVYVLHVFQKKSKSGIATPSQYRQSYRQIQKIMQAVFGIEMSLGTINNLRTEVSELGGSPAQQAVSNAVKEAQDYVQQQPIVGVDETGFKQRNGDGQNARATAHVS